MKITINNSNIHYIVSYLPTRNTYKTIAIGNHVFEDTYHWTQFLHKEIINLYENI